MLLYLCSRWYISRKQYAWNTIYIIIIINTSYSRFSLNNLFANIVSNKLCLYYTPARGIVGRVTDCGVRGIGFKSPGSILTSRTETNSLSRVLCTGKWVKNIIACGGVFDLADEQPQLFRKLLKKKQKKTNSFINCYKNRMSFREVN